jgi:hypothetical protein
MSGDYVNASKSANALCGCPADAAATRIRERNLPINRAPAGVMRFWKEGRGESLTKAKADV